MRPSARGAAGKQHCCRRGAIDRAVTMGVVLRPFLARKVTLGPVFRPELPTGFTRGETSAVHVFIAVI
jgi:hypothetical protein